MRQRPEPACRRGSRSGSDSFTGPSGAPRRCEPVGYCRRRTQFDAKQVDIARKDFRYLFTGSIRLNDHSLFRLFAAFNACFALVQFRSAVLTTEIPAAAAARHEGHPDSIFGFASKTLASATGFGHRYVSTTGRIISRDVISLMWRLRQDVARVRHTVRSTLITRRCSSLQLKIDMRLSCAPPSHGIVANRHKWYCRLITSSLEPT